MEDNQLYARIWYCVALTVVTLILSITGYNVVDRLGPQRPIVTSTTQYQAK